MTRGHVIRTTRARQEAQKQERRQAILNAAWRMFQDKAYGDVTMAAIARRVRLAKGTVFLYFGTKEALFLALTEQQLSEWFDAVDEHLAHVPTPARIDQIVSLMSGSLHERQGLIRLLAILATVLEQNVDFAPALSFKQMLGGRLAQTGARLEARLPFLKAGDGAHLLVQCHAVVVGLWHLADPAPVVCQVLAEPELGALEINFDEEFRALLATLLAGLEQQSRQH